MEYNNIRNWYRLKYYLIKIGYISGGDKRGEKDCLLPNKLKAPKCKMPEEIYGHSANLNEDDYLR